MKHYFVYSLNIFWHLQVFSDSLLYSKPLSEVCQLNIFKEPTVSLIFSTVSLFSISLIPALIISLCRSSLGYFAHGFSRYWVGSLDYWIEIFFFCFLIHACCDIYFSLSTKVVLVHYCVQLLVTLWDVSHQAPLSMEFSWQEQWSGLPCPSPGIEPTSLMSPALAAGYQ